ncbi:hypothetical protein C2845_PM05G21120 [Panicum miliaceum]|uniref:Uncharacterized protein n=1 Tax=Panicum miliaceum TaxID=4540 RepID=A0A3L6SXF3_PANMI|nr:hypothetical protein C2845_PM05G21120 [Panicum miliaceum]
MASSPLPGATRPTSSPTPTSTPDLAATPTPVSTPGLAATPPPTTEQRLVFSSPVRSPWETAGRSKALRWRDDSPSSASSDGFHPRSFKEVLACAGGPDWEVFQLLLSPVSRGGLPLCPALPRIAFIAEALGIGRIFARFAGVLHVRHRRFFRARYGGPSRFRRRLSSPLRHGRSLAFLRRQPAPCSLLGGTMARGVVGVVELAVGERTGEGRRRRLVWERKAQPVLSRCLQAVMSHRKLHH